MIVEDLKKSFLQQAFEGNISKTISTDTNIEESIFKISKQKDCLIKKYKVKNEPLYLPVSQDEYLFSIPNTWKWIRIGQLGIFKKGPFGSALTKGIFVKKFK